MLIAITKGVSVLGIFCQKFSDQQDHTVENCLLF